MSSVSSIETFIAHPPLIVHSSLSQLRYLVLSEGMPASNERSVARCRAHVWSILSRTSMEGSTSLYLSLVSRGPPPAHVYQKIKNDTFRTLNTDRQFSATVSEDSLVRCLSCFAWHQLECSSSRNVVSSYVQGMNVLLAPLLYTCPSEPMAYQLFSKLALPRAHSNVPQQSAVRGPQRCKALGPLPPNNRSQAQQVSNRPSAYCGDLRHSVHTDPLELH